ncbi:MAG: CoA transferase [Dehalococcoidia bacterium]
MSDQDSRPLLEGIRVVELANWMFAPMAGTILAEHGADVVKIEPLPGDALRGLVPRVGDNIDWVWELTNRGKRSLALDIRSEAGSQILHRLLDRADVLIVNIRGQALQRAGLDYPSLAEPFPRLIYAHATGYGPVGPDANRPAFDELSYWARGGFMAVLGPPESEPVRLVGAMGDLPSAMNLAAAIFAALYARERTGLGQRVNCSLYGGGIWANGIAVQSALTTGENLPRRSRLEQPNALYNSYRTADDRWIQFAMLQDDLYWDTVAEVLEQPEMLTDPRFASHQLRREHATQAILLLELAIGSRTLADWAPRFNEADLPWAAAATPVEIAHDPQASENGYVREHHHRSGASLPLVGLPFSLEQNPLGSIVSAPELGQHTEEVLLELGCDWEEISQFKQQGAIP